MVVEYGTGNILYASYVPGKVVWDLVNIVDLERTNIYIYCLTPCSPLDFGNKMSCIGEEVYAWGQSKRDVNGMIVRHIPVNQVFELKISAVLIEDNFRSWGEQAKILKVLDQYSNIKVSSAKRNESC